LHLNSVTTDFLHTELPHLGRTVHRLGLATSYGIDEAGIRAAFDAGLNYVFWNPTARSLTRVLRAMTPREREKLVISTGPTLGFTRGSLRRRAEKVLALLKLDAIDVFQLYWLGRMSAFTGGVVEELERLKEEGKVRALGVSIHDRERAGRLAEESPLDLLMIRYNAAHPGAEKDIFPHLEKRRPAVVAYTATSWRKLLHAPRGFDGRAATAGDCYRFCLSSPSVDVVLTGPKSQTELRDNLAAVARGPLAPDEMSWMRALGAAVHG
jgi:aryl-alcohol dehydrogenase-like predicted oxidoreductase